MVRLDREDLTRQREAVQDARAAAAAAFRQVAVEAKTLAQAYSSKRGVPDTTAWAGAVEAARRAEEAYDLALHDLDTASGGDA